MPRKCQSQPNPPQCAYYHFVVLFEWDLDNPTPFFMEVRDKLKDTIPESWYRKKWPENIRHHKVEFELYPGRVFSVFAKVEKGNYHTFLIIHT